MASIKVEIPTDQIASINISNYVDGYNYASISCKCADNQYLTISQEWKGDTVPDFVMDLVSVIKKEKASLDTTVRSNEVDFKTFQEEMDMVKKGGKKKC